MQEKNNTKSIKNEQRIKTIKKKSSELIKINHQNQLGGSISVYGSCYHILFLADLNSIKIFKLKIIEYSSYQIKPVSKSFKQTKF
jgi:hypothetical protein